MNDKNFKNSYLLAPNAKINKPEETADADYEKSKIDDFQTERSLASI